MLGGAMTHPRDGYPVALYLGRGAFTSGMIVEVHETYNIWGDESSKRHHYRCWELPDGRPGEVKTIGGIDAPEPGNEPRRFILMVMPGLEWRRLR
jgi:hypothetical protein